MNTTAPATTSGSAAVGARAERPVGRPDPEHADWPEYDEDAPDEDCQNCHGDGMDPWMDYLMPCPVCQGEQQA